MITSPDTTEDDRRDAVRELAGISTRVLGNADLDRKINTADDTARTYFSAQGTVLTGAEPYFRNLINVANLYASIAIREGIGGQENVSVAKDQGIRARSIVSAQNKTEPAQAVLNVDRTPGFGSADNRGTFT